MPTAPLRPYANPTGWLLHTLLWVGYVLFFSALWGPIVPWKIALALLLHLTLGLGFGVGLPRQERVPRPDRYRFRAGLRAARVKARWSPLRRVAATVGGALLAAVGIGQSLGKEVDIGAYPLLSGLCLIVSLGLGISLLLIANAGARAPG
ncbi:MAG: hypothetical protein P1V36_02605 [Planctomycetota bacterium]|nr:hypothetical protein [Planctomycetota bacterium]